MDDTAPKPVPVARKSLGQHFLFDPDILRRTALAAGPIEGHSVIEIGPGPGGLTKAILAEGVHKLLCVEADVRFADDLLTWPETTAGQMDILHKDATKCDWDALVAMHHLQTPVKIIANLPYNVGTRLVVDWLKAGQWRGNMAVMLQKEVVERFCAAPNSAAYGRLSVLAAAVCDTHIAFSLPPGAFRPPPKVDSAVGVFIPLRPEARFDDLEALEIVCAKAFGQRRKMLRKSLQKTFGNADVNAVLTSISIDPCARPETLTQNEFRALARQWRTYNGLMHVRK